MLTLDQDGAQLFAQLVDISALETLEAILPSRPRGAGVRIYGDPKLSGWISQGSPVGKLARSLLGDKTQPVRAILFDKSHEANWSLGWHQDRTIAVRRVIETKGFGSWTVKAGLNHVEPPFELIERMITLRVHLDHVAKDNGPLLIAPGSHRIGRVEESEIGGTVEALGRSECLARAGDVWVYKTASYTLLAPRTGQARAVSCRLIFPSTSCLVNSNGRGLVER